MPVGRSLDQLIDQKAKESVESHQQHIRVSEGCFFSQLEQMESSAVTFVLIIVDGDILIIMLVLANAI